MVKRKIVKQAESKTPESAGEAVESASVPEAVEGKPSKNETKEKAADPKPTDGGKKTTLGDLMDMIWNGV